MTKALSLSDRQLRLLQDAARAVPPRQREQFLQKVANHLAEEPSDSAVIAAINAQLDRLPVFLTDSGARSPSPARRSRTVPSSPRSSTSPPRAARTDR
jgi:hypothetical protein